MSKLEGLKAFRQEQGLSSVEALARRLDLSCSYVSQIENGHAAPALGFMRKLKAAFPEIDINMFFEEVKYAKDKAAAKEQTGGSKNDGTAEEVKEI